MISIGFTGTRHGMTTVQYHAVRRLIAEIANDTPGTDAVGRLVFQAHHGDCVGADAEFHMICSSFCGRGLVTVHPGPLGTLSAGLTGVERRAPLPHMRRNRNIVEASTVMIAAPWDATEQETGGTWKTVAMARKAKRPLAIIWPSGSVQKERWI